MSQNVVSAKFGQRDGHGKLKKGSWKSHGKFTGNKLAKSVGTLVSGFLPYHHRTHHLSITGMDGLHL